MLFDVVERVNLFLHLYNIKLTDTPVLAKNEKENIA